MKTFLRLTVLLAICAIAQTVSAAQFYEHATASGTTVRLGDVADLSDLPEDIKTSAADLALGEMPIHELKQMLDKSTLLSLARSRMPILGQLLAVSGSKTVEITIDQSQRAKTNTSSALHTARDNTQLRCAELAHAVNEGEAVRAADVLWKPCKPDANGTRAAIRYDARAHVVRALTDLAIGEQFRRLPSSVLAEFREGQTIPVIVTINHVSVQRDVTAVQDGTPGRNAFVKAPDGGLMTAYLPRLRRD